MKHSINAFLESKYWIDFKARVSSRIKLSDSETVKEAKLISAMIDVVEVAAKGLSHISDETEASWKYGDELSDILSDLAAVPNENTPSNFLCCGEHPPEHTADCPYREEWDIEGGGMAWDSD